MLDLKATLAKTGIPRAEKPRKWRWQGLNLFTAEYVAKYHIWTIISTVIWFSGRRVEVSERDLVFGKDMLQYILLGPWKPLTIILGKRIPTPTPVIFRRSLIRYGFRWHYHRDFMLSKECTLLVHSRLHCSAPRLFHFWYTHSLSSGCFSARSSSRSLLSRRHRSHRMQACNQEHLVFETGKVPRLRSVHLVHWQAQ